VDLVVPVEEGAVGVQPAPGLAHKGGAGEARGVVWREAEEDLDDEVVDQRRPRMRRHLTALYWIGNGWGFCYGLTRVDQ